MFADDKSIENMQQLQVFLEFNEELLHIFYTFVVCKHSGSVFYLIPLPHL